MRITLTHPTANRRRKFTRHQLGDVERYLSAGWTITDPEGYPDPRVAMNVAETGSESDPILMTFDPFEDTSTFVWEVPSGPIPDVLAWVGDDPARAQEALNVERANSARTSLISQLEQIAGNDTPDEGEEGSEL